MAVAQSGFGARWARLAAVCWLDDNPSAALSAVSARLGARRVLTERRDVAIDWARVAVAQSSLGVVWARLAAVCWLGGGPGAALGAVVARLCACRPITKNAHVAITRTRVAIAQFSLRAVWASGAAMTRLDDNPSAALGAVCAGFRAGRPHTKVANNAIDRAQLIVAFARLIEMWARCGTAGFLHDASGSCLRPGATRLRARRPQAPGAHDAHGRTIVRVAITRLL